MKTRSIASASVALVIASIQFFAGTAQAAEVKVMISGTFLAAYQDLVPEFERTTGNTVVTSSGSSTGRAPNTIQSRLQRGEPVDAFIMVGEALDELIKQGKVVPESRVNLARSGIGVAVRAGAPKPDISSVEAFKRALLDANSIAYSESASGEYLSTELFQRLGIADQMRVKGKKIQGQPVGHAVARGEAEIALHQISELLPIPGIDYVGPLPPEIQRVTVIAAGIAAGAKETDAARALIKFLASPAAAAIITKRALEPMTSADYK